jgi:hypothetical protein
MRNIGSGTKLQVPKQVELKLEDGKQNNGNGELQNKLRIACNEEMSVLVLGVTETTASSKSSGYAQSETHVKQQDEVIKDDMDDELKFLNSPQFIAILKSYGYDVEGGEFCYEEEIDLDKVKKQVDIVKTVMGMNVPVDDDHIYEITGIPKPKNYDAMKGQMEEERKALLQSKQQPPASDPKKKTKPKPKNQSANEDDPTWWRRFRHTLADFFDPAP